MPQTIFGLEKSSLSIHSDDFSKPKIVWIELSDEAKFALWDGALVNTAFFLSGAAVEYILGVLNSKLARWYFGFVGTSSGVGTLRWLKYTIETLPVLHPDLDQERRVVDLVRERIRDARQEIDDRLDHHVCDIYGLTKEEKTVVLSAR